ncbi:MAG: archaetidylserine decarboxylase [Gammaproteobacteria bacterium]|nr:archaetidylserine decarboxylase [Gammaproteobacteria bacterium]
MLNPAALYQALPTQAISRLAGLLGRTEIRPVAQALIGAFAHHYGVDLSEAEHGSPEDYRSFNDFFTRRLKPGARPIDDDARAVVSPADGYLSQFGAVEDRCLLQAKGHRFSVRALLTDADLARRYEGGAYVTVYLSPRDYHRVHAPAAGRLARTIEVPGRLFPVNEGSQASIAGLFCRNERLVCDFDTYALIFVGALIVASIETAWEGGPRSPYGTYLVRPAGKRFGRAEEVGRFLLGSTVIVLFPPGAVELDPALKAGMPIRMGERIGLSG